MKTPYDEADKELKTVLKKIKNEFNRHRLRIMTFDELNAVSIKKETEKLYKRLKSINQSYYLKIAKNAYEVACEELGVIPENNIDSKWLLVFLSDINEITHYNYNNEIKRKRDRFYENVLVAAYNGVINQNEVIRAYKTAINYWNRQTEQYEINVIDEARIKAFTDKGIQKVKWNTQQDGKVCKNCKELDGQIFPISNIPTSHYNCRCYLSPC